MSLAMVFALLMVIPLAGTRPVVRAQDATPAAAPLSCEPLQQEAAAAPVASPEAAEPAASPAGELTKVKLGYVPVSIFAPIMIAKDKGYFAEEGLDVELVPFPGGANPLVLTATGELDAGIGGAGPAFWNAIAQGLPIKVIAPGHQEGSPVATPLMISKKSCEEGTITSVADLKGKKVSVNAPGATEYWLSQALALGGLTLADIDLQVLPFPDAVAALETGAVDAAMIGEPLATKAEQDGIAVRLASDFDVQGMQPTTMWVNSDWAAEHQEATIGLVTAYLRAARELTDEAFSDPADLAIIEAYTGVPAALIAASVKPVYAVDGTIDVEGLATLQDFFRERELLEYGENLDPATFVDTQYVDAAVAQLNPNQP